MRYALHARTIAHTNLATDVRVARESGYDGIELWIPKLLRYLDNGFSTEDLRRSLGPLRVVMLDALLPFELATTDQGESLLASCERTARIAEDIGCTAIQVVALDNFAFADWSSQREVLVRSLNALADRAFKHGVRLAIEPVVFSRFSSLDQAIEVISEVGHERVGLCLDTWHLWTTGTPWSQVAALDPGLILAVQLSDSLDKVGPEWRDEDRRALPGEGILPMREAMRAIASTAYEGMWSVEMLSDEHWEWDPQVLATELKISVERLSEELRL